VRAAWLLFLVGCAAEAPPPLPELDESSLDDAAGSVQGTLGGRRFRARDVRFRVVTERHRERVDLFFADRRLDRCALPIVRPHTAILWARFPGELAIGTHELTEERGPFEVHFERPNGRTFDALHRGAARVRIDRVEADVVAGALHVCFAGDGCAIGAFEARPCLSRIDGRAIREPPGLDDDAIEAVGR
jgi:hypothetical protein